MLTDARERELPLARADLAMACYDGRGLFAGGRAAELESLRAMGAREPSLGRLYEGHLNGVLLAALYGTAEQRARANADAAAGHLFGTWNTQGDDPVRIARAGSGYVLGGAKTWASGADVVTRALVTARDERGDLQMCLVPLDRERAEIDGSAWHPLGMLASNSYRVDFAGVRLTDDDLIGAPGSYEAQPWFFGGALRFVAVHAGIVDRLARETLGFLVERGRANDPMQTVRIAEMRIAAKTAWQWVEAGREAWSAFDADPSTRNSERVVDAADMARIVVERAAVEVIERATRSVGANGLVEPLPFAGLVRDLTMYLRQPAPDAVVARVGASAIREAIASAPERFAR